MGRIRGMGWKVGAVAAPCLFGVAGCMSPPDARYVYQDGEYGVIGIPRNSSLGRKDYRQQARALMSEHFPDGYEIVRAEEVVEGERTLDTARKLELETDPAVSALNQLIKVGKLAKSTSSDQKDILKITECRIIYRRRPDGGLTTGHDGFTAKADTAPDLYIDPNVEVRKAIKDGTMLAKKDAKPDDKDKAKDADKKLADGSSKPKDDPNVQKASASDQK